MKKITLLVLLLLCFSIIGTVYAADGNTTTTQSYGQQIQALKTAIQEQDRNITSMREEIAQIKADLNNAGKTRSAEVLAANADKILQHTIAILDKRILGLQEQVAEIQASTEISDANKTAIIERLNTRITDLQTLKSKLAPAPTPQELRQLINDARLGEEKAIIENRASVLENSVTRLNAILEKYYKDSNSYSEYKASIADLSTKISAITPDTTIEQINSIIAEYKALKLKMVREATGGNKQ